MEIKTKSEMKIVKDEFYDPFKELKKIMDKKPSRAQDKVIIRESEAVDFASIAYYTKNLYANKKFKVFPPFYQYFILSSLWHTVQTRNHINGDLKAVNDCLKKGINAKELLSYHVKYLKCNNKTQRNRDTLRVFLKLKKQTNNFIKWEKDSINL